MKTEINQREFIIPISDGVGLQNLDNKETWMIHVLNDIEESTTNGLFVDIGVNIGQTLLKLKSCRADLDYVGFEPNVTCVNYVHNLIDVNKFDRVQLFPVGISNNSERRNLHLYTNDLTDESASIIEDFRPSNSVKKSLPVDLIHPDELPIELFENLQIIKIDVEGAELEVVQGFLRIIGRHQPFIIMEILPVYNSSNSKRLVRQEALCQTLSDLDYALYRIDEKPANKMMYTLVSEIGVHGDIAACNYIWIPNGRQIESVTRQ